jgi:hypothetical protein
VPEGLPDTYTDAELQGIISRLAALAGTRENNTVGSELQLIRAHLRRLAIDNAELRDKLKSVPGIDTDEPLLQ